MRSLGNPSRLTAEGWFGRKKTKRKEEDVSHCHSGNLKKNWIYTQDNYRRKTEISPFIRAQLLREESPSRLEQNSPPSKLILSIETSLKLCTISQSPAQLLHATRIHSQTSLLAAYQANCTDIASTLSAAENAQNNVAFLLFPLYALSTKRTSIEKMFSVTSGVLSSRYISPCFYFFSECFRRGLKRRRKPTTREDILFRASIVYGKVHKLLLLSHSES